MVLFQLFHRLSLCFLKYKFPILFPRTIAQSVVFRGLLLSEAIPQSAVRGLIPHKFPRGFGGISVYTETAEFVTWYEAVKEKDRCFVESSLSCGRAECSYYNRDGGGVGFLVMLIARAKLGEW